MTLNDAFHHYHEFMARQLIRARHAEVEQDRLARLALAERPPHNLLVWLSRLRSAVTTRGEQLNSPGMKLRARGRYGSTSWRSLAPSWRWRGFGVER